MAVHALVYDQKVLWLSAYSCKGPEIDLFRTEGLLVVSRTLISCKQPHSKYARAKENPNCQKFPIILAESRRSLRRYNNILLTGILDNVHG
jgi:hypothetical protein